MKINFDSRTLAQLIKILIMTYLGWTLCTILIVWVGASATFLSHSSLGNFLFNSSYLKFSIDHNGQFINPQTLNLSGTAAAIGFSGSLMYLICLAKIALKGRELCHLYHQGSVFSRHHTDLFKGLSTATFLSGSIASITSDISTSLALSFDQGAGQRIIQIGFGTPNMAIMFWSGVSYLFSHIMQQGADIHADQQLVI